MGTVAGVWSYPVPSQLLSSQVPKSDILYVSAGSDGYHMTFVHIVTETHYLFPSLPICAVDWASGFYFSMFRSPPHSSLWKYILIFLFEVVGGILVSAMGQLLGATWLVCFGFIEFLLVRLSPDLLLYRLLRWVGSHYESFRFPGLVTDPLSMGSSNIS